jgi:hypothetical protein
VLVAVRNGCDRTGSGIDDDERGRRTEMIEDRAFQFFILLYTETNLHEPDIGERMFCPYYGLAGKCQDITGAG